MDYKLGTVRKDGKQFSFGEVLSYGDFTSLKKAIRDISVYKSNLRLLEIVVRNHVDLHEFIKKTRSDIVNVQSLRWNAVNSTDHDTLTLEINRLFLNYLSSVRTFLDHSETLLKRQFGNDSAEFLAFNNAKRSIYDGSFAYRFFYELRNYSQHCGLPLEGFSTTSDLIPSGLTARIVVTVFFHKRILLSNFDWKKVKKDLDTQLDEFEFEPLFDEVTSHVKQLSLTLKTILAGSVQQSAIYLHTRTKNLDSKNNNVCLFSKFKKGAKKKMTFDSDRIPLEVVHEILQSEGLAHQ